MIKTQTIIAVIVLVIIIGLGIYGLATLPMKSNPIDSNGTTTPSVNGTTTPQTPAQPIKTPHLEVDGLTYNATINSPITITGKAKGWMFEASFPITILDANGKIVAQGPAQATSDWMTAEFVPFKVTFSFPKPATQTGTIVFEKDNPSGLPENAEEVRVPITFGSTNNAAIPVKLYYHKAIQNVDVCSPDSVVAVNRTIPYTQTTLKDTINLLIKGELTAAEKSTGFSTEYPNAGFKLQNVSISNGVATLTFSDANNFTIGGSCRTGILAEQIIKTAKQFPSVTQVKFMPEDALFQP